VKIQPQWVVTPGKQTDKLDNKESQIRTVMENYIKTKINAILL
jgi:hypothetical protein